MFRVYIILFISVFFFSNPAVSSCSFSPGTGGVGKGVIVLPDRLSVANDLPIGTVLWSNASWEWFPTGDVECSSNFSIKSLLPSSIGNKTGDPRVHATNIPGVGIAIYWCNRTGSKCVNDPWNNGGVGNIDSGWLELSNINASSPKGKFNTYTLWRVYLVKTGAIISGELSINGIGSVSYGNLNVSTIEFIGSTKITNRSCIVKSPSVINLTLPNVKKTDFYEVGIPKDINKGTNFTIDLKCDSDVAVNMTISSNGGSTPNVLDNPKGSHMASGLGVAIFHIKPLVGMFMLPLDKKYLVEKTSSVGGTYNISLNFRAYYYKTSEIKPGVINISTIYTFTYE